MTIIDPGHKYSLRILDGIGEEQLTFVKREGNKFPGNVGHYEGTTLQEVLRACIDRVMYLDKQQPHATNMQVIADLKDAIHNLESRAAERHGRTAPSLEKAVFGKQCNKCLHVDCEGDCH